MYSTHTSYLDIPELSEAASVARVFPDLAKQSLLSVGHLCNEGYYVTFRIAGVTIFIPTSKAILKGQHDLNTGLWRIMLQYDKPQPIIAAANKSY
jgi:hypothetical protein